MSSILRSLIFLFLLLAGISLIAFYWTFYKPLPDYNATVELSGISHPVDIHWDSFGVPHIYAETERDLYYAVGYVHAQERLWQMTLAQLTADGRFAEFFGEALVPVDRYHRSLGFRETAERIEQESSDHILSILNAYSSGVNDYVEQNRRNLPPEFDLTGVQPIEWTPTHTLAISRLMAWDMNVSWWSKMAYGYLHETLPAGTVEELYPDRHTNPDGLASETRRNLYKNGLQLLDRELQIRKSMQRTGSTPGSNAWAVSGARTDTGYPILAGDPHMSLSIPGNWFELHLSLDGNNLSGTTIPGAPVVVLGQNDRISWSLTNLMADDTDFFIELESPGSPDHYLADTTGGNHRVEPFRIRHEVIRVDGSDDQLYRVRSTDHGPVISEIFPEQELTDSLLLSMAWTGHEVSHEVEALYRMNWALSMEDFQEGLRLFKSPGQNFLYADRDNNIALFSAAGLPIRRYNPLDFRHGWDPSYDWQGWIPYDELPSTVNPESGVVANANNPPHGENYPHYISHFWEPNSRINRILTTLSAADTLQAEQFQQLQLDTFSPHARDLTEHILPVLRESPAPYDFSEIMPYLENWNFQYDPESTAATLLDAFFLKFTELTLRDDVGDTAYRGLVKTQRVAVEIMTRLLQSDSFLFDNADTPKTETRNDIIRQSMQEAIVWLSETYGNEPVNWRWGDVHTLTLNPPLFGEVAKRDEASAILKLIVNNIMKKGPYPVPGHAMSVNKGQYNWDQPFDMVQGPSVRRVVDMASPERSYTVLPTGQSGNPLSEFYGDQTELWLNGNYRFMYQDSTFFREASYQTMKLIPKSPDSE